MDWFEQSQINFGLAWTGRRSWKTYDPSMFAPPYDDAVRIMQKKGATKEDVLKKVSSKFVQDSVHSVGHLNGLGDEKVFEDGLVESFEAYQLGQAFLRMGEKLKNNEDVDLVQIYGKLTSKVSKRSTGLVPASSVNYKNYKPFMASGYEPLDNILGGIPSDGPIIAYGVQGVGKSHFSELLTMSLLKQYPKKCAAIYTLEMSAEHYLWRASRMYKDVDKYSDRMYISGMVHGIDELIAEIQMKRIDWLAIDDMDRIAGSQSPEAYQHAYLRLADLCRFMNIPLLILAQPNREAKLAIMRGERFLSPYDISWSSGAENAAALLIGLQRVNSFDIITKDSKGNHIDPMFPVFDEDHEYLLLWKSRDGWPGDYNLKGQVGPGAIVLEKKKTDRMWLGTPHGNRLWTPNYRPKQERNNGR